jgi:hypothetical protein
LQLAQRPLLMWTRRAVFNCLWRNGIVDIFKRIMKSLLPYNVFVLNTTSANVHGQTISSSIPVKIDLNGKYLFYLHGATVTELGDNGINQSFPEWGPYEYSNILDSLQKQGFYVISEIRQKAKDDSIYVNKISRQIDSLLRGGVKAETILVIGASAGWNIAVGVSSKLKNGKMKYVMMGGCWPDTYKEYLHIELYGHFLSIIEATDPHGSCHQIFDKRNYITTYQEIMLHTGLSHGFICKGRKEWIEPVMKWFKDR